MTPRLFVAIDPADDRRGLLDATGARHLRALHLRRGDRFDAIVGAGYERAAIVERIDGDGASCALGERLPDRNADPVRPLILALALADLARFDLVVEKATELGATAIAPFVANRSQIRTVSAARLERWRRIARAACEQCGRTVEPTIAPPARFESLLSDAGKSVVCTPRGGLAPPAAAARVAALAPTTVVVGPEGGLGDDEVDALVERGALAVGLGARILRFETAAIAALALVDTWLGGAAAASVDASASDRPPSGVRREALE